MSGLRGANPELARTVWEATPRASSRRVAARLRRAGMPVSHQTIYRWQKNRWRPVEGTEHPLELARRLLNDVTPLLTGDPLSVAEDIVKASADQAALEKLPDRELSTPDEVLIGRIANGDRLAMQVLFARYHVRVFRFVVRLVRDEATAEDVISEVFFDVWRQAGRFEGRSTVSTWLLGIARFKAISAFRRRQDGHERDKRRAGTSGDRSSDAPVRGFAASKANPERV
jgi:hypothetical protein